MSYEIKNENGTNVGYIDVNGRQACIIYDPNSNPLRPFENIEDLDTYLQSVHAKLEAMPAPEVIEMTPVGRREWRTDLFWRRFTPEEQVSIVSASKEDPRVDNFKLHLSMTPIVQSDDDVTIEGMAYLVLAELLTEARRNEILGGD